MTSETTLLGFGYSIAGQKEEHQLESIKLAFDDWQRRNDRKVILVLLSPKSPLLAKAQVRYPHISFGTHKYVKPGQVFVREIDETATPYCSGNSAD